MFAALPQPLEVEQVGGSVFEGLIGPIIIALAAIFAASLAAWIARRNHGQQLRHDREMRDLSHARASLSSAVETVAEAVDSVSALATAVSEATAGESNERLLSWRLNGNRNRCWVPGSGC